MKTAATPNTQFQMQYWACLGPLLALATLCVIPLGLDQVPISFSLIAIAGLTACSAWKTRGLAFSLTLVAAFIVYMYFGTTSAQHLWVIANSFSLSLAFFVTALSFTETEELLNSKQSSSITYEEIPAVKSDEPAPIDTLNLQLQEKQALLDESERSLASLKQTLNETESRLKSSLQNNEKHTNLTQDIQLLSKNLVSTQHNLISTQAEKEQLAEKVKALEYAITEREALLQDRLKVIEAVRNDSHTTNARREKELTILQEELSKSQNLLTNAQRELHNLVARQSDVDKIDRNEISTIKERLVKAENELTEERKNFQTVKTQLTNAKDQYNELALELLAEQEINATHKAFSDKVQQEQKHQANIASELNDAIETLTREKKLLESTIDRLQQGHVEENNEKENLVALLKKEKESLSNELQVFTVERNQAMANLTDIERAWRSSEGRYKQLQDQFNEKSKTLDEARRQLFIAEENLQVAQHKQHELKQDRTADEKEMERQMIKSEQLCVSMRAQYEKEIHQLHELIDALNNKLSS